MRPRSALPRAAESGARLGRLLLACATLALAAGCTSVVNRVAFLPDRDYALGDAQLPVDVRHLFLNTNDGERIEAFLVQPPEATKLVIYFHGNAGNVAQRLPQVQTLARLTGAAVLAPGYRGYGASTGRPSERGIYHDGAAALEYARSELGFAEGRVFLCGVSLGSTVAVHLAQKRDVAGIVLVTPLTSAAELVRDHGRGSIAWLAGGAFKSIAKVRHLRAPVLIIHGTDDEIIPFDQGRRLFDAVPTPKRFVSIPGARHNNVSYVDAERFWSAIVDFIAEPPSE